MGLASTEPRGPCETSTCLHGFWVGLEITLAPKISLKMPPQKFASPPAREGFSSSFKTAIIERQKLSQGGKKLSQGNFCLAASRLGADFWEGDVTKHFSVKKKGVSVKRGEAIQWMRGLVRISTGKAIQWRAPGNSVNRRALKTEKLLSSSPFPKSALIDASPGPLGRGYFCVGSGASLSNEVPSVVLHFVPPLVLRASSLGAQRDFPAIAKGVPHYCENLSNYHPGRNDYKIIPCNNYFCNIFVRFLLLNEDCFCNTYKWIASKNYCWHDFLVIILAAMVLWISPLGELPLPGKHAICAKFFDGRISRGWGWVFLENPNLLKQGG